MNGLKSAPPLLLALAVAAAPPGLTGQQAGSIIGSVVSESTLAPLVGARVLIVDRDISAVSNGDGHFRLEGVPAGDLSIRVEHVGHVTSVEVVTISPDEATFVQLRLSPVAFLLDQLRVVADRTPKPRDGASSSEMEPKVSETGTAADLLVARFPSLSVTGGDGASGADRRILVRGVRSVVIGNSPALYVDGVRADLDVLSGISASEVRSIRLLRGASASSLYQDSSNGIILLETHRGKVGGGG